MLTTLRIGQLGTDETVAFAVSELVRYLKAMDPTLSVIHMTVDGVDPARRDILWIGMDNAFPLPDARDDGIAIAVDGFGGYITGTNPRSVLIAVYRYLRALGCAWVRPGPDGERIPKKGFSGETVHISESPDYHHRGVCIEGAVTYENVRDMIDFLPKVGMNEYFNQFLLPTEFFRRWYGTDLRRDDIAAMICSLETEISRRGLLYQRGGHGWTSEPFGISGDDWSAIDDSTLSDDYRACIAEVNGVRRLWRGVPSRTNLCYSNPDARAIVTDAIFDYCKAHPAMSAVHFWLADDENCHCECANCVTKRPADWYIVMLNELDQKLTAAGLDTKVVFLLYMDLLWEPETETLTNPDRFILMFAPISRNYGETYDDCLTYDRELPEYVRNRITLPASLNENLAQLRRWQTKFDGDSFAYDYHLMWAHMYDPGYEASAKNLHADMQALSAIGIDGMVSCQVQRCFFPTALPLVSMAAGLWDKAGSFDDVADRYYLDAYGADGKVLRPLLQRISHLFTYYHGPAFGPVPHPDGPFCRDYGALDAAVSALAVLASAHQGESADWDALVPYCAYLRLLAAALSRREAKQYDAADDAVKALLAFAEETEAAFQPMLDVGNLKNVLSRLFRRPKERS